MSQQPNISLKAEIQAASIAPEVRKKSTKNPEQQPQQQQQQHVDPNAASQKQKRKLDLAPPPEITHREEDELDRRGVEQPGDYEDATATPKQTRRVAPSATTTTSAAAAQNARYSPAAIEPEVGHHEGDADDGDHNASFDSDGFAARLKQPRKSVSPPTSDSQHGVGGSSQDLAGANESQSRSDQQNAEAEVETADENCPAAAAAVVGGSGRGGKKTQHQQSTAVNARHERVASEPVGTLVVQPRDDDEHETATQQQRQHRDNRDEEGGEREPHDDEDGGGRAEWNEQQQRYQREQFNLSSKFSVTPASDSAILGPLLRLHGAMSTLFGGLCVIGPQRSTLAASVVMIVVPFCFLAGGVMPHLDHGLVFLDVIVFTLTLFFLAKCALTDPGYVAKRPIIMATSGAAAAAAAAGGANSNGTSLMHGDANLEPPPTQAVTLYWSSKGDQCVHAAFGDMAVPDAPFADSLRLAEKVPKTAAQLAKEREKQAEEEAERARKIEEKKRERARKRHYRQQRLQEQAAATAAASKSATAATAGTASSAPSSAASSPAKEKKEFSDADDHDDNDGGKEDDSRSKNSTQASDPAGSGNKKSEAAVEEEEAEQVKQFIVRIKYCTTCQRYKAPRTFHCPVCEACVDAYDHHCPFTGQCIGQRNYSSFFAFMTSLTLYIVFTLISIIAGPVQLARDRLMCLDAAMGMMGWMPVLLFIIVYTIAFWLLGLWGYHVYLVFHGQTTQEHLREKYVDAPNPFDRGAWRNMVRCFGAGDPAADTEAYDGLIVKFERQRRRQFGEL